MWRLLGLLPTGIGVLWVAGCAHFRHYTLSPQEWLVIVAFAIALHGLVQRLVRPMPLPPLPEGSNPVVLALLAAAIFGGLAGLCGGLFEVVVEDWVPSEHPLALRALWHAACTFAASYCTFVRRLYAPMPV